MFVLLACTSPGDVSVTGDLEPFGPVVSGWWEPGGVLDTWTLSGGELRGPELTEVADVVQLVGSAMGCEGGARSQAAMDDAWDLLLESDDPCAAVPDYYEAWAAGVEGLQQPAHALRFHIFTGIELLEVPEPYSVVALLTYETSRPLSDVLREKAAEWDAAGCAEDRSPTAISVDVELDLEVDAGRVAATFQGSISSAGTYEELGAIEGSFDVDLCEGARLDRYVAL